MDEQQLVKDYARTVIREMESFLKSTFNDEEFKLGKVIISTHKRRKRSWGGSRPFNNEDRGYLNLALHRYTKLQDKEYTFVEYTEFSLRPEIGDVNGDWKKCIRTLIAHEIAHAYVYCREGKVLVNGSFETVKGTDASGHGPEWQYVYFLLREKFVNGS